MVAHAVMQTPVLCITRNDDVVNITLPKQL